MGQRKIAKDRKEYIQGQRQWVNVEKSPEEHRLWIPPSAEREEVGRVQSRAISAGFVRAETEQRNRPKNPPSSKAEKLRFTKTLVEDVFKYHLNEFPHEKSSPPSNDSPDKTPWAKYLGPQ